MTKRIAVMGMILLCILSGCGGTEKAPVENTETNSATIEDDTSGSTDIGGDSNESTEEVSSETPEEEEDTLVVANSRGVVLKTLEKAIEQCKQPPVMDVTDFPVEYGVELDVRNVYFELLSQRNELSYAYELTAEVDEQGLLTCKIDYMPYRTGNYPDGFEGIEVSSLTEIIETARAHLAEDSVNIRITNPELEVADINAALSSQAGQTYIFCSLNRDGTQIIMNPATYLKGEPIRDKAEALEKLSRMDELAQQVVEECTNADMSQMEKAQALYAYLTENVVYDYRYYNDFENFNDKGRTALGALEDHLAICGGYAQALQILFEKVGIPAYVESGYAGENHMWTIANVDGTWKLFDATFDAGKPQNRWLYFNVDIKSTTSHRPNYDVMDKLIEEAE